MVFALVLVLAVGLDKRGRENSLVFASWIMMSTGKIG